MHFLNEWRALSARILGIAAAAELHAIYQADTFGRSRQLRDQCRRILSGIEAFGVRHREALPNAASDAIADLIAKIKPVLESKEGHHSLQDEQFWVGLVFLRAFEAELSYLLADTQEQIRSITHRAFVHLQRQIVVDADFKKKWMAAKAAGEVASEKLGAQHLLWHGIWSFKAHAAGARTDLVTQEPLSDLRLVERVADGFVLTEWKIAETGDGAAEFKKARDQSDAYAGGALAGNELARFRFLVVVSTSQIPVPADITVGDLTYIHINIAVDPKTPSKR